MFTAIRAMKVFAIGDNLGSVWVSHKAFRKEQRSNPRYDTYFIFQTNIKEFFDPKESLIY